MRGQYRTTAQAEEAGQQTARRVMYGMGDNKHFPGTFAANLATYIAAAKECAARVKHDAMLTAYWQAQLAELTAAQQREEGPETEDISAGRHYDGPEDDSTRLTSDGRWWDGEKWIDAYQDGAFRVYHSEDGDSFPYGVEVWNGEKRKWVQLRSSYSDGMHLLRFMSQGEAEDWVTTQLANVPF